MLLSFLFKSLLFILIILSNTQATEETNHCPKVAGVGPNPYQEGNYLTFPKNYITSMKIQMHKTNDYKQFGTVTIAGKTYAMPLQNLDYSPPPKNENQTVTEALYEWYDLLQANSEAFTELNTFEQISKNNSIRFFVEVESDKANQTVTHQCTCLRFRNGYHCKSSPSQEQAIATESEKKINTIRYDSFWYLLPQPPTQPPYAPLMRKSPNYQQMAQ